MPESLVEYNFLGFAGMVLIKIFEYYKMKKPPKLEVFQN